MAAWTFQHQVDANMVVGAQTITLTGLTGNVAIGDVVFLYAIGASASPGSTWNVPAGFLPVGPYLRGTGYYPGTGAGESLMQVWYREMTTVPASLAVTWSGPIAAFWNTGWFNYRPPSPSDMAIYTDSGGFRAWPGSAAPYTPASITIPTDANVHILVGKGPDPVSISVANGHTQLSQTNVTTNVTRMYVWNGGKHEPTAGAVTMPTLVNQPPSTAVAQWVHRAFAFGTPVPEEHYWELCTGGADTGTAGAASMTLPNGADIDYADPCEVC